MRTRTLSASWSAAFRTGIFSELRLQYAHDREPGYANSANPEAITREGAATVLTIGRNSFSPRDNTIHRRQFGETLTWNYRAHNLKSGFDFQFDRIDNFFPALFSGSYTFNTIASFTAGRPASYQQSFPGAGTSGAKAHPNLDEFSFFAQDDWRLRPDLTFNLGLRYDLMRFSAPSVRNGDPQLAAPTSTPAASGRT